MSKPLDEKSAAAAFVRAHGVAELVEAVFRETFEHGAHIMSSSGLKLLASIPMLRFGWFMRLKRPPFGAARKEKRSASREIF